MKRFRVLLVAVLALFAVGSFGDAAVIVQRSPYVSNTAPQTLQVFTTPVFSVLTTGFYNFNTPVVSGKKLYVVMIRQVVLTKDAAVTAPATMLLAQNGVDISGSTASPANNYNLLPIPITFQVSPSLIPPVDTSVNPLQLHVSVAGTAPGATTLTSVWQFTGFYQ